MLPNDIKKKIKIVSSKRVVENTCAFLKKAKSGYIDNSLTKNFIEVRNIEWALCHGCFTDDEIEKLNCKIKELERL